VVVLEKVEAMRIVQQHVGIEDEVLNQSDGLASIALRKLWEEWALFVGRFHQGVSVHGIFWGCW